LCNEKIKQIRTTVERALNLPDPNHSTIAHQQTNNPDEQDNRLTAEVQDREIDEVETRQLNLSEDLKTQIETTFNSTFQKFYDSNPTTRPR
jgi:hypothetical protein